MYDLNNTGQYALGCATHPSTRKFTLRVGSPANGSDSPYGQIDLHQLGAGYPGHIWFTHVYPPDYFDGSTNAKHEVVGTWSPDRCIIEHDSSRPVLVNARGLSGQGRGSRRPVG